MNYWTKAPRPRVKTVDEIVRRHTEAVLEKCLGCRQAAADVLGIGRRTLDKWLTRWAVEDEMADELKAMRQRVA